MKATLKIKIYLLLVAAAGLVSTAQAQPQASLEQILSGLLSMSDDKCKNRDDEKAKWFESQGRLLEAHAIRGGGKLICECFPGEIRQLRASLSRKDRSRQVSQTEFATKYMPRLMNKCAANELRSTYGDGCKERFASLARNSEKFCACMFDRIKEIPEENFFEIGLATADYVSEAATAKERGLPAPAQPAALKQYSEINAACRRE